MDFFVDFEKKDGTMLTSFQAQCHHESEAIKKGFVGSPNLMKPVKS